jgi:hypothetical protein
MRTPLVPRRSLRGNVMFTHLDYLIAKGKYESAFRHCLDYDRFTGQTINKYLEKSDLHDGIRILEAISDREPIAESTRELITHVSYRAKYGHISEGLLGFIIDIVVLELARLPCGKS